LAKIIHQRSLSLATTYPLSTRKTIRTVALPAEHGGWGFLLEPLVLGLLVAPSWWGGLLSLTALSMFLIHQPLRTVIKDRMKRLRLPRTIWGERFLVGYGLLAVLTLVLVLLNAEPTFLIPLAIAHPLVLVQLYYDVRSESRELLPEICGGLALGAMAPAIALVDGWELGAALLLWIPLAARAVSSILYVRARLRLQKDKPYSPFPTWISHIFATLMISALSLLTDAPYLSITAFLILLARAVIGLKPDQPKVRVAVIGFQEMVFGLLTVVLVVAGYQLGI
jgi:hypothetical protein